MHILPLEHQRTTNQPARVRTCRTDSPVTATTTSTTTTSPRTATERTREDNRFASRGKVRENCSSTSNLLKHRPATDDTKEAAYHVHLLTHHARLWAAPCKGAKQSRQYLFHNERKNHSSRPNFLLNGPPTISRQPTRNQPTRPTNTTTTATHTRIHHVVVSLMMMMTTYFVMSSPSISTRDARYELTSDGRMRRGANSPSDR